MIQAVNDDIIVRPVFKEGIGAILLPDQAKPQEGEFYGTVVSVGPLFQEEIKPGQKVLFTRHEGFKLEAEETLLRLRPSWVLGVLEE